MNPSRRVSSFLPILLLPAVGCRCVHAEKPYTVETATHTSEPERIAQLREEAERTFKQATLWKPKPVDDLGVAFDLAPLLVFEVDPQKDIPSALLLPWSWKNPSQKGPTSAVPTAPAVYYSLGDVRIEGQTLRQITYIIPPPLPRPLCLPIRHAVFRGVRITLGADGFPLTWELFEGNEPHGPMYVSETLERSASQRFGRPLSGRKYAVERELNHFPDTVMIGVIKDGPMPMGPYLYFEATAFRITSVLCRCMPAQMDEVIATAEYELRPAEELGALSEQVIQSPDARRPLDQRLRWP